MCVTRFDKLSSHEMRFLTTLIVSSILFSTGCTTFRHVSVSSLNAVGKAGGGTGLFQAFAGAKNSLSTLQEISNRPDQTAGSSKNEAERIYNNACESAVIALGDAPRDWSGKSVISRDSQGRVFVLVCNARVREILRASAAVRPLSQLRLRSKRYLQARPGLGIALAATLPKDSNKPLVEFAPSGGISTPLSAFLYFKQDAAGETTELHIVESGVQDHFTSAAGHKFPLTAATFPAPEAFDQNIKYRLMEIVGVFYPTKYLQQIGLNVHTHFDPERIPVICVHGLQSSSQVWYPTINNFVLDPEIGSRYQFHTFYYPTGLPMGYSAMRLRSELARFEKWRSAFSPGKKPPGMVLLGHSMGGMLSRMQVIEPGDLLMETFEDHFKTRLPFERHISELPAGNDIRATLDFDPNPAIKRVVFMATPHRGSPMASGFLGRLGRSLIRLPGFITDSALSLVNPFDGGDWITRLKVTSIDSLDPMNPLTSVWDAFPIEAPHHSLIGRWKKMKNGEFSDGVVPYASSHLPTSVSELVITSDHMVPLRKEAMEETRRILVEHGR